MARGGKRGHKGGRKQFTDPQALEREREKEQREKEWRRKRGEETDEDEEEEEEKAKSSESESQEEESSSEEEDGAKAKGIEGLIEIENPNRVQKKQHKKVTQLDSANTESRPQLSRREREEIEKQKAKERYQKLHAQGKTEEARADLARLAIIRKQREDAAKKREEERLAKEAAAKSKVESTQKALGKKK